MVLASCRLVASAVRHHNRLDAAAVNRIVVNTSADTARWMLTVRGLPAKAGRGRRSGGRFGRAIILVRFPAAARRRSAPLNMYAGAPADVTVSSRSAEHPGESPRLPMPFGNIAIGRRHWSCPSAFRYL